MTTKTTYDKPYKPLKSSKARAPKEYVQKVKIVGGLPRDKNQGKAK